jgi:hypothetical protein
MIIENQAFNTAKKPEMAEDPITTTVLTQEIESTENVETLPVREPLATATCAEANYKSETRKWFESLSGEHRCAAMSVAQDFCSVKKLLCKLQGTF